MLKNLVENMKIMEREIEDIKKKQILEWKNIISEMKNATPGFLFSI